VTPAEIIKAHYASITDEMDEDPDLFPKDDEGNYSGDQRVCACGQKLDGFYEYTDHLISLMPAGPATISRQESEDINEALDYTAEDLSYRLGQGADFEEEDIPEIEAKLERFTAISAKLATMTEETK
jgi:hypothetical protein